MAKYIDTDEKSVGAVLYPDKIIIETRNKKEDFFWYGTDQITILPASSSNDVLGETLRHHINLSKELPVSNEQILLLRNEYKKKAKFKTEKAIMQNARYVSIFLSRSNIRFEPRENRTSAKMFYGMKDKIFEINNKADIHELGIQLRNAWDKCIFK